MVKSLLHSRLYEWYEHNHRVLPWRETEDAYCIWLSEIILQQTRVAQGLEYYLRFVARWPRVEDLAAAAEDDVLREWQGLGYYSRARNLHKAAKQIVERTRVGRVSVERVEFPRTFEEIRSLPGIGDYTAGAIASFAYDLPYPAMDGNVYRVVARLMDIDEAFDTTAGKKLFHKQIDELLDRDHPRLFNSAIMEFGALYCTPSLGDNCELCPLKELCAGYQHGTAELLPVRKLRPKLRDRWLNYHVYVTSERVSELANEGEIYTLIHRREDPKDIWQHLYEFPLTESNRPEESTLPHFDLTHVLSHQRLHARFIIEKVTVLPKVEATMLVRWSELDDYAFPRLILNAIEKISVL